MYILKINNRSFIKEAEDEIVITFDYEHTVRYNTIGDAMRKASEINNLFGIHIVKIQSI